MTEKIYCRWIDKTVPETDIPNGCKVFFEGSICVGCERSPQLDLGMKPEELLRNIKGL